MNTQEILTDLVTNRGAVLELYGGPTQNLTLLGAAALLDEHRLFYCDLAMPDQARILEFVSCKRLHALAIGFYDAHGELIARIAQIRECELDTPHEQQLTGQFSAWKKALADPKTGPALQTAITAAKSAALSTLNPPLSTA